MMEMGAPRGEVRAVRHHRVGQPVEDGGRDRPHVGDPVLVPGRHPLGPLRKRLAGPGMLV